MVGGQLGAQNGGFYRIPWGWVHMLLIWRGVTSGWRAIENTKQI